MRLQSIHLKNVYGFQELKLDFPKEGPCVLAGINGAGKSTLLDSIAMFFAPAVATIEGIAVHKALYGLNQNAIHLKADRAQAILHWADESQHKWELNATQKDVKWAHLPSSTAWADRLMQAALNDSSYTWPVVCYYPSVRFYVHEGHSRAHAKLDHLDPPQRFAYANALGLHQQPFASVVSWFRLREDKENERRRHEEPAYQDPYLQTVRTSVIAFMNALSGEGFSDIRIKRSPDDLQRSHMYITKEGLEIALFNLSDGERSCIALVADLAQRLCAANPDSLKNKIRPLEGRGIVLIDELELHLHPKWQRRILGALTQTFPGCQFIVTTHSPQVLSTVPYQQIRLLTNFKVDPRIAYTEGRDTNAILEELLDVRKRPEQTQKELDQVAWLIDNNNFEQARKELQVLEIKLGHHDDEVLKLSTLLHMMED